MRGDFNPADVAFWFLAVMTVGGAILVAILPRLVHAAVGLLFAFAGVAGLYVFLSADFLAATQMLVYVVGIIVLVLFAVFLSSKTSEAKAENPSRFRLPAAIVCLLLFGLIASVSVSTTFEEKAVRPFKPTTAEIGELLLTKFLLPFEVVSVLLLAALVGAAIISRPEGGHGDRDDGDKGEKR